MKNIELFRDLISHADEIIVFEHTKPKDREHSIVIDNRELDNPVARGIKLIIYLKRCTIMINISSVDDLPWDNDSMLDHAIEAHVNTMLYDGHAEEIVSDVHAIQGHMKL